MGSNSLLRFRYCFFPLLKNHKITNKKINFRYNSPSSSRTMLRCPNNRGPTKLTLRAAQLSRDSNRIHRSSSNGAPLAPLTAFLTWTSPPWRASRRRRPCSTASRDDDFSDGTSGAGDTKLAARKRFFGMPQKKQNGTQSDDIGFAQKFSYYTVIRNPTDF